MHIEFLLNQSHDIKYLLFINNINTMWRAPCVSGLHMYVVLPYVEHFSCSVWTLNCFSLINGAFLLILPWQTVDHLVIIIYTGWLSHSICPAWLVGLWAQIMQLFLGKYVYWCTCFIFPQGRNWPFMPQKVHSLQTLYRGRHKLSSILFGVSYTADFKHDFHVLLLIYIYIYIV